MLRSCHVYLHGARKLAQLQPEFYNINIYRASRERSYDSQDELGFLFIISIYEAFLLEV